MLGICLESTAVVFRCYLHAFPQRGATPPRNPLAATPPQAGGGGILAGAKYTSPIRTSRTAQIDNMKDAGDIRALEH